MVALPKSDTPLGPEARYQDEWSFSGAGLVSQSTKKHRGDRKCLVRPLRTASRSQ